MNILGISLSIHDSAACLVQGDRVVAAAEEERFTRIKHTGEFPYEAIKFCLARGGISLRQVEHVAYSQVLTKAWPRRLAYLVSGWPQSWTHFKKEVYWHLLQWQKLRTWPERVESSAPSRPHFRQHFVEHHLAHAASAGFCSPFERAAVLSIDQKGEWASTYLGRLEGARLARLRETYFPHSVGLFYLMVTLYLGFDYHDEYQVMGLAAYGRPRYVEAMRRILRSRREGAFALDTRYLSTHHRRLFGQRFVDEFGPPRRPDEPPDERHADVAASLQCVTEEVVYEVLRALHRMTGLRDLVLAGGVALNSVMNGKITERTPFERVFIQPAAYDAGTAVGAALHVLHAVERRPRSYVMEHAYLGPAYTNDEMRKVLDSCHLPYEYVEEIEDRTAALLAAGRIVGWFQGAMEFGPRALGNRSILADPREDAMRDRVNTLVKERATFRPLAPSVLEEHVADYFIGEPRSPFMLLVHRVRPEKAKEIPAVVHVDGTARIHSVSAATNERYWRLLKAFQERTDVPVLLNTSFNVRNEPIVATPRDAIRCFYSTGLDALVMGNYLLLKQP